MFPDYPKLNAKTIRLSPFRPLKISANPRPPHVAFRHAIKHLRGKMSPHQLNSPPLRRFKPLTTPCEWVEHYRPGGYHPTYLDDEFNDGQYRVIRKLGVGSYSTVWLVVDSRHKRYAALKILTAEASEQPTELLLLQHLQAKASEEQRQHITSLWDSFSHDGPNGQHSCLVFEPMGPSTNSMVHDLVGLDSGRAGTTVTYPKWMGKRILQQLIKCLAFLHANNITHGDVQPGNILFALGDISHLREPELSQDPNYKWGSISPPVERLDGQNDRSAPKHLIVPQPLHKYAETGQHFQVKLSDFGGGKYPNSQPALFDHCNGGSDWASVAFFARDPPTTIVTPLGLRAPELILGGSHNASIDIWSFGCLVFEYITGRPLFAIPGYGNDQDDNDEHLLQLTYILGQIPDHLYKCWTRSSRFFKANRVQFNSFLEEVPADIDPLSARGVSLEEAFNSLKPTDMTDAEATVVIQLLRWILQYDNASRPTANDILRHPWLDG